MLHRSRLLRVVACNPEADRKRGTAHTLESWQACHKTAGEERSCEQAMEFNQQHLRLSDGKIVAEWAADDMVAVLHHLGAYTPPWLR